ILILAIPCVSQSSTFVIRGGTTGGILAGAMLLVIPGGLILSASLFIMIIIFPGKASTGKWFYREGLSSSILQLFGIIFENTKGPPVYIVIDQNDPNQMPRWIESGQNGIGRMRAISSDDSIEETSASVIHKALGRFKILLWEYNVVEPISLLCEAGVFGLAIASIKPKCNGHNSTAQKDSFRSGLKFAIKGLLVPLLPKKYWSRFLPGSRTEHEIRDAGPHNVNPIGATMAMVVPVLSPGPPGLSPPPHPLTDIGASEIWNTNGGNRLKGILHLERKKEMKRLRELAKASFSGGSNFKV
ncbi:hypothetical protein POM88_054854, partial [Heracleum sosnowskyi]